MRNRLADARIHSAGKGCAEVRGSEGYSVDVVQWAFLLVVQNRPAQTHHTDHAWRQREFLGPPHRDL